MYLLAPVPNTNVVLYCFYPFTPLSGWGSRPIP